MALNGIAHVVVLLNSLVSLNVVPTALCATPTIGESPYVAHNVLPPTPTASRCSKCPSDDDVSASELCVGVWVCCGCALYVCACGCGCVVGVCMCVWVCCASQVCTPDVMTLMNLGALFWLERNAQCVWFSSTQHVYQLFSSICK